VIDPGAEVDSTAIVSDSARVWGLAQVRAGARLGERTIIGRGAYVGTGVFVGSDVKIQNNALVYEPAVIEDGAFIGPAAVLTNDKHPRAVNPDGTIKAASDWDPGGVTVRSGASIGAGAVCVAPVEIGPWALVAAGAVVIRDVPAHALVAGNPAQQVGWVSRVGHRLVSSPDGSWVCPASQETYRVSVSGAMTLVEDSPA